MFDISFTEILVVGIASLSTLGVKGSIDALKTVKKFFMNIKASLNDYLQFLESSTESEEDNILDTIVDLEGNLQKRYDLSKIMPEIHKPNK